MEHTDSTPVPDGQTPLTTDSHETEQATFQRKSRSPTSLDPRLSNVSVQPTTPRRPNLMCNMPFHEFLFPKGGCINATMCDIIALLPQWFRNPSVLERFVNNHITPAVHYAILDKHRYLDIEDTNEDANRARKSLSATYLSVMRKVDPFWKRNAHQVPQDWNNFDMNIENFVPEAAKKPTYQAPPSIRFKDLADGLKQLPQGPDAGDLTRALEFVMRNMKTNEHGLKFYYVFPDDIQIILDRIGRMTCTRANFDRAVVARYRRALDDVKANGVDQASANGQMNINASQDSIQQPGGFTQHFQQLPQQASLRLQRSIQPLYQDISMVRMPLAYTPNPYQGVGHLIPIPMNQAYISQHTYAAPSYAGPHLERSEQHVNGHRPIAQEATKSAAPEVVSNQAAHAFSHTTGNHPHLPDIDMDTDYESDESYEDDEVFEFSQQPVFGQLGDAIQQPPTLYPLMGYFGHDEGEPFVFDSSFPSGGLVGEDEGDRGAIDPCLLSEDLEGHDEGAQDAIDSPLFSKNVTGYGEGHHDGVFTPLFSTTRFVGHVEDDQDAMHTASLSEDVEGSDEDDEDYEGNDDDEDDEDD